MIASGGYQAFEGAWGPRARLAWDTLAGRPTDGIPAWMVHVMDIPLMEEWTGRAEGDYARDPDGVYLQFQEQAGACFIDQYLSRNPLTMGQHGFEASARRGATTGAEQIVLDGMAIESPEDVVEHMERFVFPRRERQVRSYPSDQAGRAQRLIDAEVALQTRFGPGLLKGPYSDFQELPRLGYGQYGYVNYLSAYALYPEVMEQDFRTQADLAALYNADAARAIVEGGLPRMVRLDHDMADSRGTLVNVASLDRIWFPHFARAVQPFLDAGVRLIWHCDGNLMQMVPRLLEAGMGGFQDFQYEDGMDYERICRMTDRDGGPLLIKAGVSVTRTLPFGSRQDVIDEMKWLVEHGPPRGLFLGASSSIVPGTSRENIRTLIEGLHHYREHGRG